MIEDSLLRRVSSFRSCRLRSPMGTTIAASKRSVLLSLLFALVAAPGAPALDVGEPLSASARAIDLTDLDGQTGSLASLWQTNGALVVFAANTCPYVLDWLDRLPGLAASAASREVSFVLVNANARRRTSDDAPDAMRALADEHGFTFPYWIDHDAKLADALGASRTPEAFLFDGTGKLVYHGAIDDHSGPLDRVSEHWTRDALDQMLAGEVVTTPSSAPIGCAVQRPRRRRPQ